jgi:hypothetical protein
VEITRPCRRDLAAALASAAQTLTALAEELRALREAGADDPTAAVAMAMPFLAALQQLGVTGLFLAERIAQPDGERRFDRSVREWLDTAQLAVDLVHQCLARGAT